MAAWMNHVRDAVYLSLCAVFNLSPESGEALARFVPAYIEDATNTQAPRKTNICYYALSALQGTEYDYVQIYHELDKNYPKTFTQKTVPINCLITFYGKDADDDAEYFWSQIQVDRGKNSARSILRRMNIVLRGTRPERPVSLYEVEGTYQRRRCDVRLELAYLMTESERFEPIAALPEFDIYSNDGQSVRKD